MCGRFFRQDVTWEEYHAALSIIPPAGVAPPEADFNIAPTQYVPIVRLAPEGEAQPAGTLQMAPAMWGLVPSWWHQPLKEKKFATFNARAEGLEESSTFRGAFRHRRCLVPASGFYEWTGTKGSKTPFAIGLRNRRWF
jgi:putative SOS response-associated peptidase YedK